MKRPDMFWAMPSISILHGWQVMSGAEQDSFNAGSLSARERTLRQHGKRLASGDGWDHKLIIFGSG